MKKILSQQASLQEKFLCMEQCITEKAIKLMSTNFLTSATTHVTLALKFLISSALFPTTYFI